MNSLITRAAAAVRNALTTDKATNRFLEQTYVEVRRTTRLWAN
jgi:hypothetical protein